uniref:Uncharacterized protein n=1 Tax=Lepeophtheirus salmonis TaxID=72036 RepID=A0A0K2UZQ0_LEPSM
MEGVNLQLISSNNKHALSFS